MENTTTIPVTITKKTIFWETNYNNKMSNKGFVHIDLAGTKLPPASQLENFLFEIETEDRSHPVITVKLIWMDIFPLGSLPDQLALASHGITAEELSNQLYSKYGKKISPFTKVCTYYYKKVN